MTTDLVTAKLLLLVVFVAILGVELAIAWQQHATAPLFRWKDSIESWALLMMTAAISGMSKLFLLTVYAVVLEHLAFRTWNGTALEYTLAFLAYDLISYGFHRASHRVAFLWAIHQTHHQSEQFNVTVAMRTAPLRNLVDWPTLLPLALFGVPPEWVMMLFLIHIFGQYWIHTQWIPQLGPLGWVVNTPSHHRVHHGRQPGYQDCNYGANLIVFDRIFGTFTPETVPAEYGITQPIGGWSPLRSVFQPIADLWQRSVTEWFAPPGWTPHGPVEAPSVPLKTDFAMKSLPEALVAIVATSVALLFVVPAWHISGFSALLLAIHGTLALSRVGASLENRAPPLTKDVAWWLGTIASIALAPSHSPVFIILSVCAGILATLSLRSSGKLLALNGAQQPTD